jgi:signal transduction histidine kinase
MIRRFLKTLKYAGATDLPEYDLKRGICIGVNLLCIYVIVLNIITGAIFYFLSKNILIPFGAYLEALIVFGIIILNKRKRYSLANLFFYITISIATFYFSAILGRYSETPLMILFLFGLIFYLFNNSKIRIYCIIFNLSLLIAMEINRDWQLIPSAEFSSTVQHIVRWLVYLVVISLTLKIFQLYNKNSKLLAKLHTYSNSIKASLDDEEELNKLKNALFQHISHDLRGPYYGVSSHCFYLDWKVKQNKQITLEDTSKLLDVSNHYKYMLECFLETAKFNDASLNTPELTSINLRDEIAKIVEIHRYLADQKKVNINIFITEDFPTYIIADKLKISRIIYNLLNNGIKFTRINSTIAIIATLMTDKWSLVISDEGKGIPYDKIEQIFQPYSTERSQENPDGTGLGLYITKHLITILGAEISVKSTPNNGTAFEIVFPFEKQLAVI